MSHYRLHFISPFMANKLLNPFDSALNILSVSDHHLPFLLSKLLSKQVAHILWSTTPEFSLFYLPTAHCHSSQADFYKT